MLHDLMTCLRLARMYRRIGTPPVLALKRAARFVWTWG
jgi:hypothetical protein